MYFLRTATVSRCSSGKKFRKRMFQKLKNRPTGLWPADLGPLYFKVLTDYFFLNTDWNEDWFFSNTLYNIKRRVSHVSITKDQCTFCTDGWKPVLRVACLLRLAEGVSSEIWLQRNRVLFICLRCKRITHQI